MLKFCKKEFNLEDDFQVYLSNKREVLTIEARCIRVSQSASIEPRTKLYRDLKGGNIGIGEPSL